MYFIDSNGQPLIKSLKAKIRAFQALKDSDVKINDFNDNCYWRIQCVDVIEELKWLFKLAVQFSSKKFYPTKIIEDTLISENPRLIRGLYDKNLCDNEYLKKPLKNYQELSSAIKDRMYCIINKAMSKERVVEKVVEKRVNKSIDMNTWVTAIIGVFGFSTAFFVGYGDKQLCGVLGIATFVFGLIVWNYKQKFFKETEVIQGK